MIRILRKIFVKLIRSTGISVLFTFSRTIHNYLAIMMLILLILTGCENTNDNNDWSYKLEKRNSMYDIHLFDREGVHVARISTGASIFSSFSLFWIADNILFLKSGDIGDIAILIDKKTGKWDCNLCFYKANGSGKTIYFIFGNIIGRDANMLTLACLDRNGNFIKPLTLNGHIKSFSEFRFFNFIRDDLFSIEISDTILFYSITCKELVQSNEKGIPLKQEIITITHSEYATAAENRAHDYLSAKLKMFMQGHSDAFSPGKEAGQ